MVRTRGEDDRHACAEHDARGVGMGQERQVLGQHVACFQVWYHQDLRLAGNRRFDALDARRLGADGVVEGERTVDFTAGDLSAIRHLAERGSLDGRWNGRRHRLDSREDGDLRRAEPKSGVKVDSVLNDVTLRQEVWCDVHRCVGDEQSLRMTRHVHDEHVADAPSCPQSGLAFHYLRQQLVGVEAAFHQEVRLAGTDEFDGLLGGGLAMRHVHDLEGAEVE
jgi:hypothetical protein